MTQHTHKLRRVNIAKKDKPPYFVMQCSLPGCTTYYPMSTKLSAPTLVGKNAKCNRCGDTFELDRRALRMAEPCCLSCVKSKGEKIEKLDAAAEFFKKLEGGLADDIG